MTRLTPKTPLAEEDDYEVGFRKPPVSSWFPKGTSGNPKGRPKQALNLEDEFSRHLDEKVVITIDGRPRSITRRAYGVLSRVEKALRGDKRAVRWLVQMIRQIYPSKKEPWNVVYRDKDGKKLSKKQIEEILARQPATR